MPRLVFLIGWGALWLTSVNATQKEEDWEKGGSIEAIVFPFLQPVRPNKRWGGRGWGWGWGGALQLG